MPLDERQRAMLREMGVPVWQPAPQPAPQPVPLPVAAAPVPSAALPTAPPTKPAPEPATAAVEGPTVPVAALGWRELRSAVAQCRACSLCESRKQTVFGVGHPKAHWMIVGEAPGEQEDEHGEPFVGASGQLLDNMLRAIGLTRAEAAAQGQSALRPAQQVYIANTVKCRPPRNRNPDAHEMSKCEPFLLRQIELVQPRVILAMGRFAVQSLLRSSEAIGKLRGRVHRYQGVSTIVTYHPAYLLRSLPDKARAWEDLCLALQTMETLPERPG